MKRRDFITLVGGAATWSLAAKAQQPRNNIRRIGFLGGSSSGSGKDLVGCFASGLRDLGWREGENIKIDIRWSEGVEEKYATYAAELGSTPLDLIVVTSTPGTLAAKEAVRDIPIVFIGGSDQVHFPRPSDGKKLVAFDWTPIRRASRRDCGRRHECSSVVIGKALSGSPVHS